MLCSPLIRAKKTAELVAEKLGLDNLEVWEDLIERDLGELAGGSIDYLKQHPPCEVVEAGKITYWLYPENGESFEKLYDRAGKLLGKISKCFGRDSIGNLKLDSSNSLQNDASIYTDGNILLVAHGDIGKMLYENYYAVPWKEALTNFHFGNSEMIMLSPKLTVNQAKVIQAEQFNL